MLRDGDDITHHSRHIGEDIVVFALQDIVRAVTRSGNDIGIVDKSLAQRGYAHNISLKGEERGNLKKFFVIHYKRLSPRKIRDSENLVYQAL